MSILIDRQKTFEINFSGLYVFDKNENIIGFKIKLDGDINLKCVCTGRDFERMSSVIESASIINAVNGKPMLRTSVMCRMIMINFINEIEISSECETKHYKVTADLVNQIQYDVIKAISQKWLEVTDGR
jgi:hypothetical protein